MKRDRLPVLLIMAAIILTAIIFAPVINDAFAAEGPKYKVGIQAPNGETLVMECTMPVIINKVEPK